VQLFDYRITNAGGPPVQNSSQKFGSLDRILWRRMSAYSGLRVHAQWHFTGSHSWFID